MRISIPIPVHVAEEEAAMAQGSPLTERIGEAAFSNLYRQAGPQLWAYIRRATGEAALADDIFQDAFLRFLLDCPAGLTERQQRAYLYRTATTLLVDHWRRVRRERLWGLKAVFEQRVHNKTPREYDVARIYASLKPQEQALLWMAYVEGFDHREIAAALGLQEKSVRVLLFRARRKLGNLLSASGLGPQGGE